VTVASDIFLNFEVCWNDELVTGNSLRALLGNVHDAEIVRVTSISVANSVAVRVFVSSRIIVGRVVIALFSNVRTLNIGSRSCLDLNPVFVSTRRSATSRGLHRIRVGRASSIDLVCIRSIVRAIFGVAADALVARFRAALNCWRSSNRCLKSGRYAVAGNRSGRGGSFSAGIKDVFTDFTGQVAEETTMFIQFETKCRNADICLHGNWCGRSRAASLEFIVVSTTRDLSELSAEAELIELRALVADLVDVESTISAELIIGVQNGALES